MAQSPCFGLRTESSMVCDPVPVSVGGFCLPLPQPQPPPPLVGGDSRQGGKGEGAREREVRAVSAGNRRRALQPTLRLAKLPAAPNSPPKKKTLEASMQNTNLPPQNYLKVPQQN